MCFYGVYIMGIEKEKMENNFNTTLKWNYVIFNELSYNTVMPLYFWANNLKEVREHLLNSRHR